MKHCQEHTAESTEPVPNQVTEASPNLNNEMEHSVSFSHDKWYVVVSFTTSSGGLYAKIPSHNNDDKSDDADDKTI